MSRPAFRLHHHPATRSARVKWMLHETIGDAFEIVRVDLYRGDQYRDAFLSLNPAHAVPVLEVRWPGGREIVMRESAGMVQFLADAFPEKALAPPPGELTPGRADYLTMLHYAAGPMDMMLWQLRLHEHVLTEEDVDPNTLDRYRQKFRAEAEPQILARLDRHDFICGETFTAADVLMAYNVGWAQGYGLCVDDRFQAYLKRMRKRRPYLEAFADAREFEQSVPETVRASMRHLG